MVLIVDCCEITNGGGELTGGDKGGVFAGRDNMFLAFKFSTTKDSMKSECIKRSALLAGAAVWLCGTSGILFTSSWNDEISLGISGSLDELMRSSSD